MSEFFNQILRLPISVFTMSFEAMMEAMQGMQKMAAAGLGPLSGDTSPASSGGATGNEGNAAGATAGASANGEAKAPRQSTSKEDRPMADMDLGGDDLKYVSYSILFTKRDYEATLQSRRQEVVDYATSGAAFGAIKIAGFMGSLKECNVPEPQEWKDLDYPPPGYDNPWTIPPDDQKYIAFVYRVDERLPKSESEYERLQTQALQKIALNTAKAAAKI